MGGNEAEKDKRDQCARDVMTASVISVKEDTPLAEVAATMAESTISGVPVVDEDGQVTGVISEKDFISCIGTQGAVSFMGIVAHCLKHGGSITIETEAEKACDIMASPAITVSENTSVAEISGMFTIRHINRVPVVDDQGRLVGIVSRADILS